MTQHIVQAEFPQLVLEPFIVRIPDDNKALILEVLKRFRNVAANHKYGGMGRDYILARAALEAWERFTQ